MHQLCVMDISKTIRSIREEKRLTQLDMAEKLKMERSNYARLEARGNKLSFEQIEQIASALGVNTLEIITGEPQKKDDGKEIAKLREEIKALQQDKKNQQKLLDFYESMRPLVELLDGFEKVKHDSKKALKFIDDQANLIDPEEDTWGSTSLARDIRPVVLAWMYKRTKTMDEI